VITLVGVLGAGGGCSRPNPGFEVAVHTSTTGSLDDSSSGAPTTALPPMTTTGETTGAVTVTTGDESTSTSSSSSSSSSSGDGSSGESSTGEVPWPVDCGVDERVKTLAGHATADTFFVNLVAGDNNCLGNMGVGKCPDQSLGAVPTFKVFHVGADDPAGDFAGLFAVRFGLGKPVHDGLEVPPEAFLGVEVTLRLGRGEDVELALPPMSFDIYQMPPVDVQQRPMDMPWNEGDNAVMKVCGLDEASYNCKRCDESMQEQAVCLTPWPNDFPWQPGVGLVMTAEFAGVMAPEGDLQFLIPGVIDEWDWLFAEGLLLVPQNLDVMPKPVEVRAREYADEMARPFIKVVHCPFKEG